MVYAYGYEAVTSVCCYLLFVATVFLQLQQFVLNCWTACSSLVLQVASVAWLLPLVIVSGAGLCVLASGAVLLVVCCIGAAAAVCAVDGYLIGQQVLVIYGLVLLLLFAVLFRQ
ncbi:hypothetical protein U1Q18_017170 [Sarracenia purpurea var. burkii]